MKRSLTYLSGIVTGFVIVLLFVSFVSARGLLNQAKDEGGQTSDEGIRLAQAGGGDEDPANAPSGGQDEPAAPGAVAAVNPVVYFAPQDNDANATVLVLFNTTSVTQTVTIQAFAASGTHTNFNVVVGGNKVVHAVSDSVIASPPPSFANSVVVNFTDFTTYAVMTIPVGIKFDGYLIFNPGTGTVDPRADQGAIPLRFSADPLTVLLPTVLNKP